MSQGEVGCFPSTVHSMATLILIHESGLRAEYELRPGTNRIGRDPDNDWTIEHESISDHHCEIEVQGTTILVRDLASTNGTWVDTVRIDAAHLTAGQTLQLGEVQFALQLPVRVRAAAAGPSRIDQDGAGSPPAGSGPGDSVHCPTCNSWLKKCETQQQRVGLAVIRFCPRCGSQCFADTAAPAEGGNPNREFTFVQAVIGAFGYPFRENGGWMLVGGAVALTLTKGVAFLAGAAPFYGLLALVILTIGVTGYFFAFLKDVLGASARGEDNLPGWPELTGPQDFAGQFLQLLALVGFCFGPMLVAHLWIAPIAVTGALAGANSIPLLLGIPWLLGLLGAFYFPMAFVGVALADSIAGLNPVVILPSIFRIFVHYCLAWVLAVVMVVLVGAGGRLVQWLPIPFVTTFCLEFLTLYWLVVTARILGVMYYVHRRDLDWFR